MKKISLLLAAVLIAFSFPAHAADTTQSLQEEWARIKYQVQGKDAKLAAIAKLEERAASYSKVNPKSADALIWEAIILATTANITKSLSGLPKVEKAKSLLEESLKLDPRAMEGAGHMTLGSLYYQVPGWPVGFGNDKLADQHLKSALAVNPDGMDTNYWYGAFLLDDGKYAAAVPYLEKALAAPDRANRKVADAGRKAEIREALAKAKAGSQKKSKGNE